MNVSVPKVVQRYHQRSLMVLFGLGWHPIPLPLKNLM